MMETLGEFLRHRREEAGLSLEDLAGRTRIRIENLRSLEREDLEALPTEPYVRGFVKLVCRELGLEPTDGIVRYETLRQQSGPVDEMTWDEETVEAPPGLLERALGDPEKVVRKATAVGRWGGVAAGAVAVAVLAVLAFRWIDPFAPRTTKPIAFLREEPAAPAAPELVPIPAPRSEPEPVREVAAAREAEPPPSPPEAVASESAAPAGDEVGTSEPAPARVETAPAPLPVPEPEVATTPAEEPPPTLVGTAAPAGERQVLRLEALRDVRISVLLDGVGFPRTRSLAAGETATFKADESFVLDASDGGAVRVILGDRDLGTAGEDRVFVKGLTILPR